MKSRGLVLQIARSEADLEELVCSIWLEVVETRAHLGKDESGDVATVVGLKAIESTPYPDAQPNGQPAVPAVIERQAVCVHFGGTKQNTYRT